MATLTRRGALQVTASLDHVAQIIQQNHAALGIDQKIATDFAYRCDLLSDAIERRAAAVEKAAASKVADENTSILGDTGNNDPATIGEDVGGPLEIVEPPSEPWMDGHFSQQNFRQLGEAQEQGDLGPVFLNQKLAALEAQIAGIKKILAKSL